MTPYVWRNFVNGVPTAREGQIESFFLQKRHSKYKLSVKKKKTGQKTGKQPPKRGVFIGTSALIPQTVRTICGIPQTVRTICGILHYISDKDRYVAQSAFGVCPLFNFLPSNVFVLNVKLQ